MVAAVGAVAVFGDFVDKITHHLENIRFISLDALHPHEEILEEREIMLRNELIGGGILMDPIIVDKQTGLILDGMHRYNNLDHSMITGAKAVDNLFGANTDVWDRAKEDEYLEGG